MTIADETGRAPVANDPHTLILGGETTCGIAVIEQHRYFTAKNNRVVDRIRSVHERMARVLDDVVGCPHLCKRRFAIERFQDLRIFRFEFHDPKYAAARRWVQDERPVYRFFGAVVFGGRCIAFPEIR